MNQVTLSELLDKAVETMPLFRKRVWEFRLKFPRFRERVLQDLQEKLHDSEEVAALGLQPVFALDSFSASAPFELDVEKLEKLLALIVKYLPMILELISKFFL